MLPTSHRTPIKVVPAYAEAVDVPLGDAFAAFISAAGRLEHSHGQLHEEVAQLRTQLEERNGALASSLEENKRIRILQGQILDALPCGVVVVDTQQEELVLMNPEAERQMGVSGGKNRRWADLPSPVRAMITSGPSQVWRRGDEQQIAVHESGAKRWLNVRSTSIGNSGNEPGRDLPCSTLILTLRDTTSQKLADEERESSRHMIALAEMATLLAHEIRNPLGSLELFATLISRDTGLTTESKKWVEHLQAGVRSLAATVNNVLCFHTPGSGSLVALKLSEVLVNGLEFVRPLARQSGVDIVLEESLGDLEIMGEPAGWQQLLLNLGHNAIRHTPPEGKLLIRARVESRSGKRFAVVEFSDSGCGISPDVLPHIFDAGFSTNRQSTGLGLAVCKQIVATHQGTITATSQPGTGATFHMEFPAL